MSRWQPDAESRLIAAALTLFAEQGYDLTTVAEIADAAGLTKRTFFRYFTDKREVLFKGAGELAELWINGIVAAPRSAGPLAAVSIGLEEVVRLFADRHHFAGLRAKLVNAHPELQERELIKLQSLAGAIEAVLVQRGVAANAAILASQTGVTVFHVAFARWVTQEDPTAFRSLIDETFAELQSVTAGFQETVMAVDARLPAHDSATR